MSGLIYPDLTCRVRTAFFAGDLGTLSADYQTHAQMVEQKVKCKLKCYVKPMKNPLGVGTSKGNQGTTRGKEKIILTSVGIEPTT